ncbi:hypothetical protein [Methylorubrum extorquens]|uniref:Uncharacterized protein n=1 Tax=Methylorubrum extorquens TaxID=408 RepID=A0AAX3WB58_METEX|nr:MULTISPECIES: hypothetical protein [Methylobacteriaceae]KQO92008.1 hypothetical protein ASF33_17610 [Methylobacterium sp. Leaf92]KQQ21509.1 hypothetical protein ASF56_18320 [Methylobacterium sp. Leaf122]MCG5247943.1 hypothetical protein [Methylorubrum extorquens]WHQ68670.1 hypothetical protein KEC54_20215 [Methylorubrum extorquens]
MTNIIRPNFGGRDREAEPAVAADALEAYEPLHVYGTAAGYLVALLEDASGPEGRCLKVVIGAVGGNVFEAVAVTPATDEGRVDADMAAMAVLRALEVVEQGSGPASA